MPDEQGERRVHQPVMDEERVGHPEACVALAVPKEEAGDREEQREEAIDSGMSSCDALRLRHHSAPPASSPAPGS
jgi:hypothetical protein